MPRMEDVRESARRIGYGAHVDIEYTLFRISGDLSAC